MANTKPLRFKRNIHIKVDDEFDERLEKLRAARSPIPNQSGLIRALVDEAYEREIGRKRKR